MHIGDVMVRGGDLFGDGVNIAARLQSTGEPGGVCISGATYDQVRKVLPMIFVDLGVQHGGGLPASATRVEEASRVSLGAPT